MKLKLLDNYKSIGVPSERTSVYKKSKGFVFRVVTVGDDIMSLRKKCEISEVSRACESNIGGSRCRQSAGAPYPEQLNLPNTSTVEYFRIERSGERGA